MCIVLFDILNPYKDFHLDSCSCNYPQIHTPTFRNFYFGPGANIGKCEAKCHTTFSESKPMDVDILLVVHLYRMAF